MLRKTRKYRKSKQHLVHVKCYPRNNDTKPQDLGQPSNAPIKCHNRVSTSSASACGGSSVNCVGRFITRTLEVWVFVRIRMTSLW